MSLGANDITMDNITKIYEELIPVPVLAKNLTNYVVSDYILKYCAVPVAVWGCLGNLLSFRVMVLPNNRNSAACLLLAALACSDCLLLLMSIHKWLLWRLSYRSDWMCKIAFWYGLTGKCSSAVFIMVVTLQRCIGIVWPLKRMEWMTPESTKRKVIPVVFLSMMAYTSYRMIGTKADPGILACDAIAGTALFAKVAGMMTLIVDGLIPFLIISVMNTLIIRAIKQSHRELRRFREDASKASEDKTKSQETRQLTFTLVLVCTAFLLLVTPLYILLAYYSFVDNKTTPETFATFQLIKTIFEEFIKINSGINFWLYCAAGKRFRSDVKAVLCCSSSPQETNSTSRESIPSHVSTVA